MKKLFFLLLCFSFPVWAIECPPDSPIKHKGECVSCYFFGFNINESECSKCPSREFIDGKCVVKCKKNEFRGFGNDKRGEPDTFCKSCDSDSYDILTTKQECDKCPNRLYIDGFFCISKDKPLNGHDCNSLDPERVSKKVCDLCPSREYIDGICRIKEEILIGKMKEECNCKKDEFIGYSEYASSPCYCLNCSEKAALFRAGNGYLYATDKQECDRCSNRKYVDGKCILNECSEREFRDKENSCISCKIMRAYESSEEECLKCSNRQYIDGKCILKECPKDYPIRKDGDCSSCDSFVNESECAICAGEYINGKCRIDGKFLLRAIDAQ